MEENKTVVTNENFDWNAFENDLGVYSQPKEEIAAAYDKTLSNVAVGEAFVTRFWRLQQCVACRSCIWPHLIPSSRL